MTLFMRESETSRQCKAVVVVGEKEEEEGREEREEGGREGGEGAEGRGGGVI